MSVSLLTIFDDIRQMSPCVVIVACWWLNKRGNT